MINKSATLLMLLTFIWTGDDVHASEYVEIDPNFSCAGEASELPSSTYLFDPIPSDVETLNTLAKQAGISVSAIDLRPADINNAAAFFHPISGKPVIAYDVAFFRRSENNSLSYWSSRAILAHELAHHINRHLDSKKEDCSQDQTTCEEELEADKFAGFVLAGLGAPLGTVLAIFENLKSGGKYYPSQSARVTAAKIGWMDGFAGPIREVVADGSVFVDQLESGGTGPEMVALPGGSFLMGSPEDQPFRDKDEGPVHRIELTSFAVSKYEVTFRQYETFVRKTGYLSTSDDDPECRKFNGTEPERDPYDSTDTESRKWSWRDEMGLKGPDYPMNCVTWVDAVEYTDWLTEQTGNTYRLLTEAEWEYAARGGTSRAYIWDEERQPCLYANVADLSFKTRYPTTAYETFDCVDSYVESAPVGKFEPNGFGLYDMIGNVAEITCSDYWKSEYRLGAKARHRLCPKWSSQGDIAVRGGDWLDGKQNVRVANRTGMWNSLFTNAHVGFRVARDHD